MKHLRAPLLFVLAVPFTAAVLLAAVLFALPAARAEPVAERVLDVELAGDVLYALADISGDYDPSHTELRGYDVSDAMSPVQVGSLSMPNYGVSRMIVEGDFAYLSANDETVPGGRTLWVVDVSDPANPDVVDQSVPLGGITALGRYVYVDGSDYQLSIYRVDDEGHPQLVSMSEFAPDASSGGVSPSASEESMDDSVPALDWPYVYIGGPGVLRVNVSDPANPVAAGEYSWPSAIERWSVRDGAFYTVYYVTHQSSSYDLVISDVDGEWRRSFEGGPVSPGAGINDYEMVWGRYLFVSSRWSFFIYDLINFSTAVGTGDVSTVHQESVQTSGTAYHYEQGVIYLARGEGGLDVMQAPFPTPTLDNHLYFPAAP